MWDCLHAEGWREWLERMGCGRECVCASVSLFLLVVNKVRERKVIEWLYVELRPCYRERWKESGMEADEKGGSQRENKTERLVVGEASGEGWGSDVFSHVLALFT